MLRLIAITPVPRNSLQARVVFDRPPQNAGLSITPKSRFGCFNRRMASPPLAVPLPLPLACPACEDTFRGPSSPSAPVTFACGHSLCAACADALSYCADPACTVCAALLLEKGVLNVGLAEFSEAVAAGEWSDARLPFDLVRLSGLGTSFSAF